MICEWQSFLYYIGSVRESFEKECSDLDRCWSKPWMQEHERTSHPSLTFLGWLKASLGVSQLLPLAENKNTWFLLCQGCWQEEHNKIWQQLSVYRPQILALNEHAVEMPRESPECPGKFVFFFSQFRSEKELLPRVIFFHGLFFFLNLERWWNKNRSA